MKISFTIFFLIIIPIFSFSQQSDHVKGEILVQFVGEQNQAFLSNIATIRQSFSVKSSECLSLPLSIWKLSFDENTDEKTLLETIRHNPNVIAAQLNYYVKFREEVPPNDPQFLNQWYLQNVGQSGGLAGADIQAAKAWDITQGGVTTDGDTIIVAVIDDGTSQRHVDLAQNRWYNWREIPQNGIDDDLNGYEDDFEGWNMRFKNDDISNGDHGVGIESIIGARGNNGQGVAGINWRIKLMHIKVGYKYSNGNFQIPSSDIIAAYNYVLTMRKLYNQTSGKKGAFVVATNSSFGIDGKFPTDEPIWCSMYDALGNQGVLNIAATSNNNVNVDAVGDIPSTCTSNYLIVVTTTDRKDLFGGHGFGAKSVDLAAPGVDIYTANPNNQYGFHSGTSYAAPIVTGIAALAYSTDCSDFTNYTKSNPAGAAMALRNWILTSGVSLKDLEGKTVTTQRVNAFNVLNKVTRFCGSCLQPTNIDFLTKTNSTEVLMNLPNNTDSITIRYRKVGSNDWNVFKQKSDPVYLNDLQPCTNYEFELSNQCQGVNTNTGRYQFKTDGCCQAPPDLNIQEVATNKFVLNVKPVTIATSYKVKITEGGVTDVQDFADNTFVINNLKSCKKYNVSISSVCENKLSDALNFNLKTKGCGACLEQPYCLVNGISQLEWIDSFRIHNFRIKTGDNSGYYRSDSVISVLNLGKKYPIGLTSGYVFIDFQESARVWIDYNADGDFADKGELIWEATKFVGSAKDSFLVPVNAVEGITRMRIAMKHVGSSGTPPQLCESFDGGEVEDYCIKLEKSLTTDFIDNAQVMVFPNPFNETITLKNTNPENKILSYQLISPDGRILYHRYETQFKPEITLTDLPPLSFGMYFFKIDTDKGVLIKKICKF